MFPQVLAISHFLSWSFHYQWQEFDACFQELKPLLRYQILSNIKPLGLPPFLFSQLLQLKMHMILTDFIQEINPYQGGFHP